jgi:hypothetical protein
VGLEGGVVGIDTFGESAPAGVLFKHFGFTVEKVVETAKAALGGLGVRSCRVRPTPGGIRPSRANMDVFFQPSGDRP